MIIDLIVPALLTIITASTALVFVAIGEIVVEKVKDGVITSEPFLKLNDAKPSKFAEDPELTIKP